MKDNLLALSISVLLSVGRNIASKKTATDNGSKETFFFSQSMLFLSATLLLGIFNIKTVTIPSRETIVYGVIYGVLLIVSQWAFTLALKSGNTSVCSVVYSFGFLLPTLSGAIFWAEEFVLLDFLGLIIAVAVILLGLDFKTKSKSGNTFLPFVLAAMLASGGLGIMQKVQQSSSSASEKAEFLIIAFALAFLSSLVGFFTCKKTIKIKLPNVLYPALAGACFGGANLFNTVLAGRMKSSVFFPVQNISTVLLSTVLGIVFFKERLTLKNILIVVLGAITVVIFSL